MNLDRAELLALVGVNALERGRVFVRAHRVSGLSWNEESRQLSATVQGNGGRYDVELGLESVRGSWVVVEGECDCPVGWNCKHVAAVALVAAEWEPPRPGGRGTPAESAEAAEAPGWAGPLLEMLADRTGAAGGTPLAIELAVELPTAQSRLSTPRLLARLMRPGARGGWVNGSLSWGSLDSWDIRGQGIAEAQLAAAATFGEVMRARELAISRYWYAASSDQKVIDLTDWSEDQLWPLLTRARRAGITFIHAVGGIGDVPPAASGELFLEAAAGEDGVEVSPALELIDPDGTRRIAGAESVPLQFLGGAGHGLILSEPTATEPQRPGNGAYRGRKLVAARLRLVHLARDTPDPLAQMVLERRSLRVPAADVAQFTTRYAPVLRNIAPVRSSDGTVTVPEISGPRLVLGVTHGEGTATAAAWRWRYEVGEDHFDVELSGEVSPLRDLDAEAAVATAVDLSGLELGVLVDADGQPAATAVRLDGMEAARFSFDALEQVAQRDDIDVVVEGQAPDYRDVDESLEIVVSTTTAAGSAPSDWFDLNVAITVEGRELPLGDVFAALARGQERMLLPDGAHFSLNRPELEQLRRLIEEAQALSDVSGGTLQISRYQAGLWRELVGLGVVTEQAAGWQRAVEGVLGLEELPDVELPAELTADLRPYQREGFAWLVVLWRLGLGGILADDMGLGKTLQALALICHARSSGGSGTSGGAEVPDSPFLVIAPTSVVANWVTEAARFAPGLRVSAVTDTLARARVDLADLRSGADVVVTTYNLARLDAAAYTSLPWAGVILDEAQAVKNHNAKAHAVVRRLSAPFKLAVSGTPMENNLMELWSLLSIVAPGLFPDPTSFKTHYQQPIERERDAERLALLRRRIRPLMLRRRKELVASELPAKQEQTLTVSLHPRHRKLYDRHLARERQRLLGLLEDFDANRFSILTGITKLRQLSLHPGLVDPEDLSVPATKLTALSEQLADVAAGGHRALVFSQFTGFLRLVREHLDAEGIAYAYLDGRTRQRAKVIDGFRNGRAPVFLISLKAGGSGLNLTEADYCFLLDPWWNPATEAQAVDRTHRIGQTRQVMVYRLVSENTIEEKVVALARRKAELFASVIDDGDVFSASVTADDIRGLLS